jgi:ribonuclease D
MSKRPAPPAPVLITDPATLAAWAQRLKRKKSIALDTEAASFHRYLDRVYLVQVSSDDETALIDPLAVDDLSCLGSLIASPSIETIFHDADYDLRILDRDYGFRARRIWDTRVAAQLAGEPAFGLGTLLEKYFGITVSKKLQRADWSRRPLTDEMIQYAATDTAYLTRLRDELERKLSTQGRLHWAEEEFVRLEGVRWTQLDQGDGFLRLKGAKALSQQALAVLRAVWEWRERTAASLDRAPFRVLGNEALIGLARGATAAKAPLDTLKSIPETVVRRYGEGLLAAIQRGLATPPTNWPKIERGRRPKPDPKAEARYHRLRALRAARAEIVGLDAGLLCPNGTLQAIARAGPSDTDDLDRIVELRRWQREALEEKAMLAATA